MALHFGKPDCHLKAKGNWQGLLSVRAPRHHRILVLFCQIGECPRQRVQPSLDDFNRRFDLQTFAVSIISCVVAPQ